MARLRQRDLAAFSEGLAELYADAAAASLPNRILACLRRVFPCEFASFSLLDRRRGHLQASALAPVLPEWPGMAAHRRYLHTDPAARHILRTGDQSAVKISDFVSLRQYRNLGVYSEVFGRVGCDRRLGFAIGPAAPVSLVATLNRAGRDFSEEERHMLNALRPHLLQANDHARIGQQADAARKRERENLGQVLGVGLAEIDGAGRLLWVTPRAEALLKAFFPVAGRVASAEGLAAVLQARITPAVLRRFAKSTHGVPAPTPHVLQFGGPDGRRLKVCLSPGTAAGHWQLLLEEARGALPPPALARALHLTEREGEVLHWVMQGKTNGELGAILAIAEKTASRHLENIYAKLGVGTRTAAVRAAHEAGVRM